MKDYIFNIIMEAFQNSFDQVSQTHIVYYLGPGPEVKGFGDWPDQAFDDFRKNLEQKVNTASPETLAKWKLALNPQDGGSTTA